ncbi:hypothetical protein NEOLEDRAFT_846278 [Neolentinus lepideus HHB14362 ss-1]|uniref:Uncharacterized protein n=1 Tax=Neolentinus lepideus HHB14362 ss-1 TaxID=1314782 RepID=A0A165UNG4_9AGAM|nr:hypothetical protein NEOLEDRAFT_846278 [Neolentinus lepideus HHB14362 ss-1]
MSSRRYDTYDSTRTGRDHNHERWIPPSAAAEQGQRRPSSSRHQSYDYGTTTESSRRPHSSSRVHTSNGYPSASLHQSSASQPVPGSSSGKVPSSRTQQQYAAHAQKPSISTSRPQVPASQQSYTRTDETVKRKERTEAYDPYAHHRQQSGLDQPTPHSSTERVQVTEDSRRAHRSRHEYASASASRAASLAATAPQAYSYDIAGERAREKETLRTARDERDRYEDEERARRRRQREEDKLRARQYVERGLQDERYRAAKDERKREDASKPESRKLAKSSHATRAYDERFKDSDESDASRRRLTASYGGRYPGEAVAGTSAQHNTIRQSTIYPQSQRVQSSTTYNGVPSAPIAYPYNLDSSTPRQSSAGLHRSRGVSGQISSEYQLPEQEGYSNHHRLHRERERDRERPRNRETALSGSETEREPRQTHVRLLAYWLVDGAMIRPCLLSLQILQIGSR